VAKLTYCRPQARKAFGMSTPIYLDYQATTPTDPRVVAAMRPYLAEAFGNPHSEHAYGWEAAQAVDDAAADVAKLIGADPGEIVFTSGATEANNLALQGIARGVGRRGGHIITTAIEHKCVLNTAYWLHEQGFAVDIIPVGSGGRIDPDAVRAAIRDDTILVSVMLANNEIGTIQPVAEIGALCGKRGIVFHTDAAQAIGKIPVDVSALNTDLLSLSAHKFYGPKGIGALYVSRHCSLPLVPLIIGGAQQRGLRAGTVPAFLCAGLGQAARIALEELDTDAAHALALRQAFLDTLAKYIPGITVNGDLQHRLPGNLNIRFQGIDGDSLLTALQGQIAASTGSACNAGLIEPSYVLCALGLNVDEINSSIRFGFGRFNKLEEIVHAAHIIAERATRIRDNFALAG
jgi:cysteine desulfurase